MFRGRPAKPLFGGSIPSRASTLGGPHNPSLTPPVQSPVAKQSPDSADTPKERQMVHTSVLLAEDDEVVRMSLGSRSNSLASR